MPVPDFFSVRQSRYDYQANQQLNRRTPIAEIQIKGKWLIDAGFAIDAKVNVQIEQGKLVLVAQSIIDSNPALRGYYTFLTLAMPVPDFLLRLSGHADMTAQYYVNPTSAKPHTGQITRLQEDVNQVLQRLQSPVCPGPSEFNSSDVPTAHGYIEAAPSVAS